MKRHRGWRRTAALGLVLSMLFGMSMTSMAYYDGIGTSASQEVRGYYRTGESNKTVYNWNYYFGNFRFDYTGGSKGVWDPYSHSYVGESKGGGWFVSGDNDTIRVTNHSNVPIRVSLNFESKLSGIEFGFGESEFVLDSAEGTDRDNAPSKTTFTGPTESCRGLTEEESGSILGTITLHVSGVE